MTDTLSHPVRDGVPEHGRVPKSFAAKMALLEIVDGLGEGDPLTPERDLAERLSLSRATIRRAVLEVLLPELLPAIVSGGSLCLLLTLNEFGIVLFIGAKGVNTLPVLVYTKGIVSFDYPSAAVIACVQVVLSLLLYAASRAAAGWLGGRRVGVV